MTNGQQYPGQGMPPQPGFGMPTPIAAPQPKTDSPLPMIGGILLLVGAIAGLAWWVPVLVASSSAPAYMDFIADYFVIISVFGTLACLFAALGGVFAIMKRNWAVALAGSIVGILFCGGWYCLGALIAIAALILIAIGKEHFH